MPDTGLAVGDVDRQTETWWEGEGSQLAVAAQLVVLSDQVTAGRHVVAQPAPVTPVWSGQLDKLHWVRRHIQSCNI